MEDVDLFDQLLQAIDAISDNEENETIEVTKTKKKILAKDIEDDLFLANIDNFSKNLISSSKNKKEKSLRDLQILKELSTIHNGDTDSSDDDCNKDYQNSKYNECGKDIKHMLNSQTTSSSFNSFKDSKWTPKRPTPSTSTTKTQQKLPFQKTENNNTYTDPFFGIRICNPLISSLVLQERMANRTAVSMSQVKQFIKRENNQQDWVIAGVVVNKSPAKTSQKGTQFLIWTLSDLKGDLLSVAMFLFGNAYKQLWKTTVGTVLGILNPSVMETREGCKDQASLSVDNAQKVMIFGQSKDYATCKTKKKDGNQCNAFVNKNNSEYCVYHIRQEYQKLSRRSELQANFVGGGLTALRNKVLGKNEVFYAGKSYMAIPAKKSTKLIRRDTELLRSLSGTYVKVTNGVTSKKIKPAASFDAPKSQRIKDLQLLKKLYSQKDEKMKDKSVDINDAAADLLEDIDRLEKELEVNTDSKKEKKSIEDFDFLNSAPSTSKSYPDIIYDKNKMEETNKSPKLNNSKLTEDILQDLDKLESPYTSLSSSKHLNGASKLTSSATKPRTLKLKNEENNYNISNVKTADISKTNSNQVVTNEKKNDLSDKTTLKENLNESLDTNQSKSKFLQKANLSNTEYDDLVNNSKFFKKMSTPKLTNFGDSKIDLTTPHTKCSVIHIDKAKLSALKYIQKHGQIKKEEEENKKKKGVKRFLETTEDFTEKRKKLADDTFTSERFKKIMALQSKHTDLLEAQDQEKEEKYFKKLELREKMEEKMSTIFKVECKAVKCLTCKYESFSAADKCKEERHVIKVIDAVKRFFKCAKCGNRTVSLKIIPLNSCSNCGGSKWDRTTMMKEKIVQIGETLSIRGLEEKYVGHVNAGANINLLVPDA